MTLQVKRQVKTKARTPEAALERMFASACDHCGVWSRHMSDAFAGVPDRYLAGGRWVELKSIVCPKSELKTGHGLSPEQRVVMASLQKAGDKPWYLALILTPSGKKVLSLQTASDALNRELFYPIYNVERFPVYNSENLDAIVRRIVYGGQ